MFKWLKRLLGTEITDSVTTPVTDTVVVVESVATSADTATVETKPKRTRAKKTEAAPAETKPKQAARSTPPKRTKTTQ